MIPQLFLGEMGIMFLVFFALKDVLYIYGIGAISGPHGAAASATC